jgi:hypothetical protein
VRCTLGLEPWGGERGFGIDAVFLGDCPGLGSSMISGVGAAPGIRSFGRLDIAAGTTGVGVPVLNSGEM